MAKKSSTFSDVMACYSGRINAFIASYEIRKIFLAQGLTFHSHEIDEREKRRKKKKLQIDSPFVYLSKIIGSQFKICTSKRAEYTSSQQRVHFIIKIITSKDDFKKALETKEAHVIYGGHSRYGRGACFDTYPKLNVINLSGCRWILYLQYQLVM